MVSAPSWHRAMTDQQNVRRCHTCSTLDVRAITSPCRLTERTSSPALGIGAISRCGSVESKHWATTQAQAKQQQQQQHRQCRVGEGLSRCGDEALDQSPVVVVMVDLTLESVVRDPPSMIPVEKGQPRRIHTRSFPDTTQRAKLTAASHEESLNDCGVNLLKQTRKRVDVRVRNHGTLNPMHRARRSRVPTAEA